jgi:hypothetical protein
MNLIALFASLGLAYLAICLILSMRIPDDAIDPEVGAYRMQGKAMSFKMDYEAVVRYWLIKKLAGDSGIILNIHIKTSEDDMMHFHGFANGSLVYGATFDIPLSLTPATTQ